MPSIPRKIIVDQYQPGDEVDILALNLAEYGPTNVMVTPEAFQWRYAENPAGQTEITVVRDQDTGHVIGFTWTIPLRMRLFGKDMLAALTANQMIQPDYRDSMAFARMARVRFQMLRQTAVPFRFNFPVERLFERAAAIEKMSSVLVPLLLKPLNPVKLAQKYLKKPLMGMLVGWGGKLVSPFYFRSRALPSPKNGLIIEWAEQFDERFDDLWKRVQDKYSIMTVRDCAFLSWRFATVADRSYRILTATVENRVVGYVVLRCTSEIRSIPTGLIMDFLVEPGSATGQEAGALLLEEAWRYFQQEKMWLAGGLMPPHTQEYKLMQGAGYRDLGKKLSPRIFRVAFNCFNDSLPNTDQIKLDDWFLTIADYEAH